MYRTVNIGPMGGELEKMPTLEQAMAVCLDKNDDVAEVAITDSYGNEVDKQAVMFDVFGRMTEDSRQKLRGMLIYPESEISEIRHDIDCECETTRWVFVVRP